MVSSTIFDLSAFHARHHATTDFQSAIYRFDSGGHCYFFGYRAILASIFRAAAVVAADLMLDCSLAHHLDDSGLADFSISSCLLVDASLFAHYLCHGDFNLLSSNLFVIAHTSLWPFVTALIICIAFLISSGSTIAVSLIVLLVLITNSVVTTFGLFFTIEVIITCSIIKS